jgi:hypothetical protein
MDKGSKLIKDIFHCTKEHQQELNCSTLVTAVDTSGPLSEQKYIDCLEKIKTM